MGFDVVEIQLANGQAVLWIDSYNDLLTILDAQVANKRRRA